MKYPSVYLMGERAHGEILSIAFAGAGQHQDAGGKIVHAAPNTTSNIFAKSISKDGGRGSYRGLLEIAKGAHGSKSKVVCDALLLDEHSRSDTYPTIRISEDDVNVGHEATVSKVGDDQLFYLMSHGISEEEASKLIVNGFIEPITKELPMEYAVEMNRLIELQMEGSIAPAADLGLADARRGRLRRHPLLRPRLRARRALVGRRARRRQEDVRPARDSRGRAQVPVRRRRPVRVRGGLSPDQRGARRSRA